MKKSFLLLLVIFFFSCSNEKTLYLAEIENASVTEVLDVSAAYIFYDETQPDSTLFNRKNLISTTNWLVNVDKRLNLKQAIPHITVLQEKRRNAKMHKNENAKNYFTCNDTTIENLGFLEFTSVQYILHNEAHENNKTVNDSIRSVFVDFLSPEYFSVSEYYLREQTKQDTLRIDTHYNKSFFDVYDSEPIEMTLSFNKSLSFQNYITLKKKVQDFTNPRSSVNKTEFIY